MAKERLWQYDSTTKTTQVSDEAITLPNGAFRHSQNLERVIFPKGFETLPKDCFLGCPHLEALKLPSAHQLGENACANCPSLKKLYLPDGATTLPKGFLEGAKALERVRLPRTLTKIDAAAFKNATSLKRLDLPKGLEHLGKEALFGCHALEKLYLPKGLKRLEYFALPHGGNLTEIAIDSENPHFTTLDNVLFSHDKTTLILFPSADKRQTYQVPEGVETIEMGAFYKNRHLKKIILPKSLKTIGRAAFSQAMALEEVIFQSSPNVSGANQPELGAFSYCQKLFELTCPPDWYGIPPFTFAHSALVSLHLNEGLMRIGRGAFYRCPLEEVTFPKSLTRLAEGAFYGTKHLIFQSLPKGYYTQVAGKSPLYQKEKWHNHTLEIAGNAIWLGGGKEDMWQDLLNEIDWSGENFNLYFDDQGFESIEEETDKMLWVLSRLKSPQTIDPRAKARYLDYLKTHQMTLLEFAFSQKDSHAITLILDLVSVEAKHTDRLLALAKENGLSELMPKLLSLGGEKRCFSL